jgi:FlaA1/EpsC-like NDP-sugar epimerase/lipopolysaccharide/colanic/teichoic acid biosynthesis glycosyltransferase
MAVKRAFDVTVSLAAIAMLSPVFVVLAILIKLLSPGPIFFSQERIGKNFKPFNIYKFRTMTVAIPSANHLIAAEDEKRITGVGRILRKTKLDELPQFFNVLVGDMSIVGPRPPLRRHAEARREDFSVTLSVRPGITDFASLAFSDEIELLSGKDDPEAHYLSAILPEKLKLSKEYVRTQSFSGDLTLILTTILKLIYPKGFISDTIDRLDPFRRTIVVAIETAIFILACYFAFFLRFDGRIPDDKLVLFIKWLPLLVAVRLILLFAFSLDRGLWRYVSGRDVMRIVYAVSIGTLVFFVLVRYAFGEYGYPRSVYAIDLFLNVLMLLGVRLARRLHDAAGAGLQTKRRAIVIGAGDAAEMLLRDVEQSGSHNYRVVGLVDDDPLKRGLSIRGVRILGARKNLPKIIKREAPDEFIVAMPSAEQAALEEITKDLRQYGLPIKTLPSLWHIISNKHPLGDIKPLEAEDVLFRPPADAHGPELKGFYRGKVVMITGAGGSIGSELSRLMATLEPKRLVLFERHEENLYKIDMELRAHDPAVKNFIVPVIGDVADKARVREVIASRRPDVVFHAAAYKHVPLMEMNPTEAFKTNAVGTKVVAEAAGELGVSRFVLISTDKAVNPANVMGATKRIAEGIIARLSRSSAPGAHGTRYMAVRFGNVLGSSGSVVPLFIEQIKRGGPITVTHPEMTRYFMTIPEAVRLVAHAAVLGEGGSTFVLDMGEPVKIIDLAERILSIYGYRAGVDMAIKFIGLRPGEKLHEALTGSGERLEKTSHPKISRIASEADGDAMIAEALARLREFGHVSEDAGEALRALESAVL